MKSLLLFVAMALAGTGFAVESALPLPGGPADLDGAFQAPIQPPTAHRVVQPPPAIPPERPTGLLSNDILVFDGDQKETRIDAGTVEAQFKFAVTNVSPGDVTVFAVRTSCGCTTAHLPPMPWKLAPGDGGELDITMNVAGKNGTVAKTVTVSTDKGNKVLIVKTVIAEHGAAAPPMTERERNRQLAAVDRQAVFKGDCARCHSAPAEGKKGPELYASACGICHEAEHRADMVPDLHVPRREMGRELLRVWITRGKEGSLMPAFAAESGGPLSDRQIDSLVTYMTTAFPVRQGLAATTGAAR
jgi:mono/diheme cytochrome c family protein